MEDVARDVQADTDANDSKKLYHLMKQVYRPKSSASAYLLSKESSMLFTEST